MNRSTKSYLVDVNVWIALVYGRHIHHGLVRRWFEGLHAETAFFCRLTQLGFLRLLTTRHVMGADTVSQREAWKIYDQTMLDPRVGFLAEPATVDVALRRFTQSAEPASQVWSDAYLAAVASAAGLAIATLDQGFRAIKGIDLAVLLE